MHFPGPGPSLVCGTSAELPLHCRGLDDHPVFLSPLPNCRRDHWVLCDPSVSSFVSASDYVISYFALSEGHFGVGWCITAGGHSSPLTGRYIYCSGSFFQPSALFGIFGMHSPLPNIRAGHSLCHAQRQHRVSRMGLTGPRLPLLRLVTSSVSGACAGGTHLCLCSRAGFSLHCSSETLLCSAQWQRKAPRLRPDSGAYWLVPADLLSAHL
ncbi:hypothetical protein NDU88_006326 [Pleurodeles waltl]|uniref:Uncharacterized protein n=1 Tax=Pleurodeles waltl TaxID=8319 RepID=A0AAV7PQB6_PLEWA|nr:hypothetical protein NDU88_006326 [Pleurodeles waltl]